MRPIDAPGFRRALRAYEIGRLRHAVLTVTPFAVLLVLAALLITRPILAAGIGSMVIGLGIWATWRERALQNAFVVGVLSGAIPLGLVTASMRLNHFGSFRACASACMTAAALGGLAAGSILAIWLRRSAPPALHVGFAALLAFGTGAMACSCLGFVELAVLSTMMGAGCVTSRALRL